MKNNMAADMPHLVEHDGGALPRNAVLPVVVGGVHGGAAEHAGDSAGSIGAIIGDATPGGRGADVTGVVVSQEGFYAHKLPHECTTSQFASRNQLTRETQRNEANPLQSSARHNTQCANVCNDERATPSCSSTAPLGQGPTSCAVPRPEATYNCKGRQCCTRLSVSALWSLHAPRLCHRTPATHAAPWA
jgi:hypothetical protein